MGNKKIRFGILGCGTIGDVHAKAILELDGAELCAICDVNPDRVKKYAESYGIKAYTSYDEMLADPDIDAVTICTPSGMHADQAIKALKAHKHVITEKPMALTEADAKRVCDAAKNASTLLGVVFQMRYSEDIQRLKKMIDNGELGRLVLCDLHMKYWRDKSYFDVSPWRGTFAMDGGGALMNQGIHGIDIMNYLFGVPKIIGASVKTLVHDIEVEDTAVAAVEYPSGALGIIEAATSIVPGFGRRIEVHGTRGYAIISDVYLEKLYIDGKFIIDREVEVNAGSASDPTKLKHMAHLKQFRNFVSAIRGEEELIATAEDGLFAVALIEKIYNISKEI